MRYRTLDKNWQFNRVYGRGKSYVHPHCVLYVAKNHRLPGGLHRREDPA